MFSGFVEVKGEEKVPHGVGDILTNEGQYYKGMFSHGVKLQFNKNVSIEY